MGTTYQAQVEVFFPADQESGSIDIWQSVSRWELQKDYGFSIAWSQVCETGWPDNHAPIIGEREEFLEGRRWADGLLLACLDCEEECSEWFAELRLHVCSLIQRGYKVRVITWDE